MRPPEEIQAAHDLLHDIVFGRLPDPCLNDEERDHISLAMYVLCWVLDHPNDRFETVLPLLAGFVSKRYPGPLSEWVQ